MRNAKSQPGSHALNEGAKAGYGLAYNQVLHLVRSFVRVQCFSVFSYAPIAHPVASQPTRKRVMFNTLAVSRNDLSAWRRFSSGTRQFSIVIKPFWTTLSAILF